MVTINSWLVLLTLFVSTAVVTNCGKGSSDPPTLVLAKKQASLDPAPEPYQPSDVEIQRVMERTQRGEGLKEALRPFMTDPTVMDVKVKWNYSDNVKLLWGPGFKVSLARMGCSTSNLEAGLRCFLERHKDAFGINLPTADLRLVRSLPIKHGNTVHRFRQYESGLPVPGADVAITTAAPT